MKDYFEASILQHLQRGEHLVGLIPKPTELSQDYHPLVQTCNRELEGVLQQLDILLTNREMQLPENQPERLRRFRRAVQLMGFLESTCVAALVRRHDEDGFLSRLVALITREISYPLLPPLVSALSQQYFHIYPTLNLLFVPLSESAFLLHLPDLYHELAHPLLTTRYNPHLKPLQNALWEVLLITFTYIADEKKKEARGRGPKRFSFYLKMWEKSWVDWAVEFFCDLFAIYTLGAAYAWAHLHLCAKGNENPYRVPVDSPATHPANNARMKAMLCGLELIDFAPQAQIIEGRWTRLVQISGVARIPEYDRCFPDALIEMIAQKAYEGVYASGFRLASPDTQSPIYTKLNQAWEIFWNDSQQYVPWEASTIEELRILVKS